MTMPYGNISDRAFQMARMFAGERGGTPQTSPMPRGINMQNMVGFAGTPAGQALMGNIRSQAGGQPRQPRRRPAAGQQRPRATAPGFMDGPGRQQRR